ncbi:uncharacterized protein LOC129592736 [Paramacrobiotus metropolitanus]|uniref:uncharacterized protein LOC129592736 n=1 Tax=Paramacrobiotus metropolitanus TaxID=2943436 RepID=UPI002445BD5E|nr:uncharacterized protein LOC129592736 [Paramacrobiotus metropolitanus]
MDPASDSRFSTDCDSNGGACIKTAGIWCPSAADRISHIHTEGKTAVKPKMTLASSPLTSLIPEIAPHKYYAMQRGPITAHQPGTSSPSSPIAAERSPKTWTNGFVHTQMHHSNHHLSGTPHQVPKQSRHQQPLLLHYSDHQHTRTRTRSSSNRQNLATDTPASGQNGQETHRERYVHDTEANCGVPVTASGFGSISNYSVNPVAAFNHGLALYRSDHLDLIQPQNSACPSQLVIRPPPAVVTAFFPADATAGSTVSSAMQTVPSTLYDWSPYYGYDFICIFCQETVSKLGRVTFSSSHLKQHLKRSRYCYGKNLQFLWEKFSQGVEDVDDPLVNGQVKRQLVCLKCKTARKTDRYRLASPDLIAQHMQRYHAEIRPLPLIATEPQVGED